MVGEQIRSGRSTRRRRPVDGDGGATTAGEPTTRSSWSGADRSRRRSPPRGAEHVRTVDELPPQGAAGRARRRDRRGARRATRATWSASAVKGRRDRRRPSSRTPSASLAAARAVGARHVVAISSAVVHGAWPDRPVIHDADPLAARRRGGPRRASSATCWRSRRCWSAARRRQGSARSRCCVRPRWSGAGDRHVRDAALRGAAPADRARRDPAVAVRARRGPRVRRAVRRGAPARRAS